MGFMPLGSCCGCVSLKGGAKLISILCMIFTVIQIIAYVLPTVSLWSRMNDNQVAVNMLLVMVVLAVAQAAVSLILLVGAIKDKPNFIACWVVSYSALLIVGFIFVTGLVFIVCKAFVWILCLHVVVVYFVLVAYSLYRQYVDDMYAEFDKEKQQRQQQEQEQQS